MLKEGRASTKGGVVVDPTGNTGVIKLLLRFLQLDPSVKWRFLFVFTHLSVAVLFRLFMVVRDVLLCFPFQNRYEPAECVSLFPYFFHLL